MNCSYRILEDVHIGVRVRKTKDKSTVAYHNQPITDVYIEKWDNQGFRLKHPAFPTKENTVWLDFNQLPINTLNIEMGYIKNPIVFVEAIASYTGITSMVFIRADTFDYLELLSDKKHKEESKTYKPSQLKPGDRVISAICKDGNVMVYLGTFNVANLRTFRLYSYYSHRIQRPIFTYVDETPERVFFAYEKPNGKYNIQSYPVSNKVVKEVYNASDKGRGNSVDPAFTDGDQNLKMLNRVIFKDNYQATLKDECRLKKDEFPDISISGNGLTVFIQKGKNNIRKNAVDFVTANCKGDHLYLFETEKAAKDFKNKNGW